MARRTDDDDDAPWLAEASTRPQTRVSKRSFFWTAAILLGLIAVLAIGTIMLMSKKDSGSSDGYMNAEQAPLIEAEPGPFKVRPADPKGLAVEGQDQTIYAAGEGEDIGSTIDQTAQPEAPLPRPGEAPAAPTELLPEGASEGVQVPVPVPSAAPLLPPVAAPKPAAPPTAKPVAPPVAAAPKPALPKPAPPKPAPPKPAAPAPAAAAGKSGTVQLGAFSSAEKAEAAWAAMAARNPSLGSHRVVPVEVGGKTLYRLRASGPAGVCARVKAGGDACTEVN